MQVNDPGVSGISGVFFRVYHEYFTQREKPIMSTVSELKNRIEKLDPEIHKHLISILNRKIKVIEGKKSETDPGLFEKEFISVMKKLNDLYNRHNIDGLVAYTEKNYPDLEKEADREMDKVDRTWQEGLQGKLIIDEFRMALKEWYLLKIKAIEFFKKD